MLRATQLHRRALRPTLHHLLAGAAPMAEPPAAAPHPRDPPPHAGPPRSRPGLSIMDRVHGLITLPPELREVYETPAVQRLRSVKQLGSSAWSDVNAVHTRLEHSIGVSHLAVSLFDQLRASPAGAALRLDDRDRLCVGIAGLCHDIGHAAFSHTFEKAARRAVPDAAWSHEDAAAAIVDHLFGEGGDIARNGGTLRLSEGDVRFVKLLIAGLDGDEDGDNAMAATGRSPAKRVLLDIVNNREMGLDVDKLDYLARDPLVVMGRSFPTFNITGIINAAHLAHVGGRWRIAYCNSVATHIFELFRLRAWMHLDVYQNLTSLTVDAMLTDLLQQWPGRRLFDVVCRTPLGVLQCTDDIIGQLRGGAWASGTSGAGARPAGEDDGLLRARRLLERLDRGQLYSVVGVPKQLRSGAVAGLGEADIEQRVADEDASGRLRGHLRATIRRVDFTTRDGARASNPLMQMWFFNPRTDPEAALAHRFRPGTVSPLMRPRQFEDRTLFVFVDDDALLPEATAAMDAFCRAFGLQSGTGAPANVALNVDLDAGPELHGRRPPRDAPETAPPSKRPLVPFREPEFSL